MIHWICLITEPMNYCNSVHLKMDLTHKTITTPTASLLAFHCPHIHHMQQTQMPTYKAGTLLDFSSLELDQGNGKVLHHADNEGLL